ncbi:MAG: cytochrome c maturation protein CcmE [Gammaproteobacteria bacterium]|nr:cytochrome c maturation protein CcmE [Gammaproteobacteria bacterium]
MNPKRKRRLMMIILILIGVGSATALTLTAFNQNMMFFYSPSQVAAGEAPKNRPFRVGGMVKENSLSRDNDGITVRFIVHDNAKEVTIRYTGILPDLFREGQGIVAHGKLGENGVFIANEVLAKHDENYMPPEVAAAMKPKGIDKK